MQPIVPVRRKLECERPEGYCYGLWPHPAGMQKQGSRCVCQRVDVTLSNAILVVRANSTERDGFLILLTMILEKCIGEAPVIRSIQVNHHAVSQGKTLEGQFSVNGLGTVQACHQVSIGET